MNIIKAISDRHLFRPFLANGNGSLATWSHWNVAQRCLYGLPIKPKYRQLILECTGRDIHLLPQTGFDIGLFLTGRRSGKSKTAAVVGGYEAALSGKEKQLSKGELGLVPVISPSRFQSQVVKSYIRALFTTPMLEREIVQEHRDGFTLSNNVRIAILTGDYRYTRGFTLLACIVDEAAFFGLSEESKVRSDTELIRSVLPGLATVGGRLIVISSPYARKGWCYKTHKRNFGNNSGSVLVWNCPSRVMNPTLPQSVVDAALVEDLQAAKSEYLGEFRDDVALFLPRELVEQYVIKNRFELLPRANTNYAGFADVSGGRHDDAALSVAHRNDKKIVIDCVKRYRPPHNPNQVIASMCEELRRYHIRQVRGDAYAAEFVTSAFRSNGIRYAKSEYNKSQLFLEFLPALCSGAVELLDDEVLIDQLASLERRTRSGGKDIVCKPVGGRDDVANVVSGVCAVVSKPKVFAGGGWHINGRVIHNIMGDGVAMNRQLMARAIAQQQSMKG